MSLVDAVVIAAMGILGYKLPKSDRWYWHRYASQFRRSRKMTADQKAAKIEEMQSWWGKLEHGDPGAMPVLKDLCSADRQRFVELFRGDTARRVRDGSSSPRSRAPTAAGRRWPWTRWPREKERSLRRDYPSALEGMIIEDVVILFLAAHEADLRARAMDDSYSLKQAAYYNDQRRQARRMLNGAIKLLVTVHQKLAETEKLAHPDRNDWRYSNRLGQYAHSRN